MTGSPGEQQGAATRDAYDVDGFLVDPVLFELRREGQRVPLEPQAFDVLTYLVEHHDRVVSKEELMDAVWGGRFVTESAVTSRIKQVRRALGDTGSDQRVLRTVHGRGYHLVAQVRRLPAGEASPPPVPAPRAPVPTTTDPAGLAPVQYTVSDGLAIAHQVTGGGDIDIVLVAGFISHLEQDWGDPRHAHFLHRLGTMGRLIRFDKRGTGMSDRPPDVPDLETRIHDVLAVMDAVGSERAYLLGYSEGGPMVTLFAATYPERVAGLVLYGASVKRTRAPDYPWARSAEERRAYTEELATTWDWEGDLAIRCPSADEDMKKWWARRCRAAATPSTVRALMHMNDLVDVREALPAVRVPTLVVHRTDDLVIRVEEGRYLAQHIPGARFVELDGEDHFVSGDPDQILDPIEDFLTARPALVDSAMALAAIVVPTGDDRSALVQVLVEAGARDRLTVDGRPVLLLGGPATAVRTLVPALAEHPGTGAAVHVAEVDRDAAVVGGDAIDAALELADATPPGQVRVTPVTRDLLRSTGISLQESEHGAFEVQPA